MEIKITVIGQELIRKGACSKFSLLQMKERRSKRTSVWKCAIRLWFQNDSKNHDHARKPILRNGDISAYSMENELDENNLRT